MQFQSVFSFQQPRPHEAGGKYAQGIIVRRYKKDSAITIRVELTANHRGYFEFRLCPNNAPRHAGTQACLDKYVLRRAKFAGVSDEQNHETRYYPAAGNKVCKKPTVFTRSYMRCNMLYFLCSKRLHLMFHIHFHNFVMQYL